MLGQKFQIVDFHTRFPALILYSDIQKIASFFLNILCILTSLLSFKKSYLHIVKMFPQVQIFSTQIIPVNTFKNFPFCYLHVTYLDTFMQISALSDSCEVFLSQAKNLFREQMSSCAWLVFTLQKLRCYRLTVHRSSFISSAFPFVCLSSCRNFCHNLSVSHTQKQSHLQDTHKQVYRYTNIHAYSNISKQKNVYEHTGLVCFFHEASTLPSTQCAFTLTHPLTHT